MFVSNLCPSIIRENEQNFKRYFTIPAAYMFIFGAFFHRIELNMNIKRSYNDHKGLCLRLIIKFNTILCRHGG